MPEDRCLKLNIVTCAQKQTLTHFFLWSWKETEKQLARIMMMMMMMQPCNYNHNNNNISMMLIMFLKLLPNARFLLVRQTQWKERSVSWGAEGSCLHTYLLLFRTKKCMLVRLRSKTQSHSCTPGVWSCLCKILVIIISLTNSYFLLLGVDCGIYIRKRTSCSLIINFRCDNLKHYRI